MALLREVMDALGEMFPWDLAIEGDNSGLQVGSRDSEIRRVLCSVDMTSAVADQAIADGFDLLVTHHPVLFGSPLLTLDTATTAGLLIERAVAGGLNVVACHTNADSAIGGTADIFADHLRMGETRPLEPATWVPFMKVVVFVPPQALEDVSAAMADAGAGNIGNYRHCGFRSPGVGSYIPREGARPYSGEVGRLNREDEVRLEMLVPSFLVQRVVDAMRRAHPYEEVAFDVYRTDNLVPWGLGRTGDLREERKLEDLTEEAVHLCLSRNALLAGDPGRCVSRVAVVTGAAGSLVQAAVKAGAEVLIAGEVSYHNAIEARERGLALICLGHLESERVLVPRLVEGLRTASDRHGWSLSVEGCYDQEGPWN